ncbi:MAG: MBL fold metallo-hydrolase [Candidatus Hydrogenedentota bacterium]|nr:MAG: MBL fold metallo-hydrolase [Candidatus Hydrogenedentota bacterium]
MGDRNEQLGLVKLWDRAYAYLQKDEGLGWSNAGMIRGKGGSLLIDTLFDLSLTQKMLDQIARKIGKPIRWVVNTHHNGDHCWGNQLVADAEIIGHRLFPQEMMKTSPELTETIKKAPAEVPGVAMLQEAMEPFDFSGIKLTPPTRLFDERLTLEIDDREVQLIHVGPAHTSTDVIVFFPEERILYAGDIIFRLCTPIGWEGTFDNWIAALNRIVEFDPRRIVPGHGPLCGTEGAIEMREYLQYVYKEAKECFDREMSIADAAKKIDLGPYAGWTEPERIVFNIARAYREFRGEPHDTPVDFMEMAGLMAEIKQPQ